MIKLFFFLLISLKSSGQDSLWKKNIFNEVLTFQLPAQATYAVSDYVKAFGGGVNSNYYGFQYYDTIFLPNDNEEKFQTSITSFINGRIADPTLKKYNVTVVDTVLNSTKGLLAKYTTTDISEAYKQIYYFVTMANSRFYGFYVYSPFATDNDEELKFFFRSIRFNPEKIKERSFRLKPVYFTKKAGQ